MNNFTMIVQDESRALDGILNACQDQVGGAFSREDTADGARVVLEGRRFYSKVAFALTLAGLEWELV